MVHRKIHILLSLSHSSQTPIFCFIKYVFVLLSVLKLILLVREDHIYLIKVLFGLLTTKHVDSISLDKFAKVTYYRSSTH